jgi:hypothetical protein
MSGRSIRKDKINVEKEKEKKGCLTVVLFYSDFFSSFVCLCSLSRGGNGSMDFSCFRLSSSVSSCSDDDFNSCVLVDGVP